MKLRFRVHGLVAGALLMFTVGPAMAQINPNPDCRTGAEGRPSFLGISGGNYNSISGTNCCTGTLGALVHDVRGHDFVLSTNTVLARISTTKGPFKAHAGEKIVQPGLVDTGCFKDPGDGIGTLARWVPLQFGLNNNNSVDAAIARVKPGMFALTGDIFNIGPISSSIVPASQLVIGSFVQKMGRTSCLTEGQIDAIDATGKVAYVNNGCHSMGSGNAQFSHQILIFPSNGTFATTSDGGSDSGAVVVTEEACPRAIGLVFGGTSNGITVINPIDKVLKALKVQMVGGCSDSGASLPSSSHADAASADAAVAEQAALSASVEAVRAVKDRSEQSLLKLDAVAGTAIGRGDNPNQAAMLVMVKKDTPEIRAQIPTQIDGVPVKIVESGEFQAL